MYTSHGTRQFEVVRAMFIADRFVRKARTAYLEESAQILRQHLPDRRGACDHHGCRLLLTRTDVRFVSPAHLEEQSNKILTLGYTHVTKEFADLFFGELVLSNCRIETTRNRLITHYVRCGCRIGQLLPLQRKAFFGIGCKRSC